MSALINEPDKRLKFSLAYENIYPAPHQHPKRGRGAQNDRKDGNDRGVEDKSAQDGGKWTSKEHGKDRSPELFGSICDFSLEESKPGRKKKPCNGQWDKRSKHTWQER